MSTTDDIFQKIITLAKIRGFVYPSSEIYDGFAGVYDYGPLGVELARRIKDTWWKNMVQTRDDIVGLDSGIATDPRVWEASGHTTGFTDPMVYCKKTGRRYRADHLLEAIGVAADERMSLDEFTALFEKHRADLKLEGTDPADLSSVTYVNLLVESNLGHMEKDGKPVPVYLRGETCQGIYINYKNVLDTMHPTIPFGIAQIGKAFRNEISPRQFLFRTREFEQMEMQYFVHPSEAEKTFSTWKDKRMQALIALGLQKDNLRFTKHERLVFYAKDAYDIEYNYPFGWKELEGIHNRGDYDLSQHSKHSGIDLSYYNQEKEERFTPCIIETSIGVGRLFLAILADAYQEETLDSGDVRTVLKLKPSLAPVQLAILPLMKKEPLQKKARELYDMLKSRFSVMYDENQSIGRRYRRQDEIGTPLCLTVDFESLDDGMFTVRDRDSMKQEKVTMDDLATYVQSRVEE